MEEEVGEEKEVSFNCPVQGQWINENDCQVAHSVLNSRIL